MIGLEIRDQSSVAVALAPDGTVRERAETDGEPATSALAAVERVIASFSSRPTIGITAALPGSESVVRALEAVRSKYPGSVVSDTIVGAGTAAVAAEASIGAARGRRHVVYFATAEHATAGIVRDGAVVLGAHRIGPAIAWLALNPVEREDYRKAGCLEAEVAASGIVRRFVWRIKAGDRSQVQDLVKDDLGAITVGAILDAARERDGVAVSVVRDTAKYLGMAAANLVAITDPEALVLGGIMASASDLLLEPIRVELSRKLPATMMSALLIETAALGADAPAIGAARLAAAPA